MRFRPLQLRPRLVAINRPHSRAVTPINAAAATRFAGLAA